SCPLSAADVSSKRPCSLCTFWFLVLSISSSFASCPSGSYENGEGGCAPNGKVHCKNSKSSAARYGISCAPSAGCCLNVNDPKYSTHGGHFCCGAEKPEVAVPSTPTCPSGQQRNAGGQCVAAGANPSAPPLPSNLPDCRPGYGT